MKLYMYAVVNTHNDELCTIKTVTEVKEYPGTYENVEDKHFYSPWDNYLPKDCIGRVFRHNEYVYTNILYGIYLLEDDRTKAMSLIKEVAQKDFNDIKKQLEVQQNIIGTICGSANEIIELSTNSEFNDRNEE